ncbi:MAG: tetratricopeptide repeat protein [Gemmatimonadota bacterium]|nr:tetratricopeptide repeat protein [Gemmatimonadota bacterium]
MVGQIRAEQGFLPDARTNFLTYAERVAGEGDFDESFRALVEFCDLAPDELGVRITVADQMSAQGREEDAVEQLAIAHRHSVQAGDADQAEALKTKILAINPEVDVEAMAAGIPGSSVSVEEEPMAEFGESSLSGDALDFGAEPSLLVSMSDAVEEAAGDTDEATIDAGLGDFATGGADAEDEGEAIELPGLDIEVIGDPSASATADAVGLGEADLTLVPSEASEAMESLVEEAVSHVEEPLIQDASLAEPRSSDEQATDAEIETGSMIPATGLVESDPFGESGPAADGGGDGFVDLGAMILGSGEEKSTRFTVAYEEPSEDEEADFAKMLSQFKDKVSENLDSTDVRAHHDLGTAYKEMGLLDEAIGSFQAALRASADHLPTYELMGQTFLEMGQPEAAVKSLERAVEVATSVDDELVGIYYYLGRAYEELENRQSALEYYDRVFSLDINFADVTERLRALR